MSQSTNKILQAAALAALGLSLSGCNPPPDRRADSAQPDSTATPSPSAYHANSAHPQPSATPSPSTQHAGAGAYVGGAAGAARQDDDNDRGTEHGDGHSAADADGHGGFGSSGAGGDGD